MKTGTRHLVVESEQDANEETASFQIGWFIVSVAARDTGVAALEDVL